MQLNNVKLIFIREMRDQLRDRRTLFLIAVLPLLLYPIMGMTFFQFSQFIQNNTAKVAIVGDEQLADLEWLPTLLEENQFAKALVADPRERQSLELTALPAAESTPQDGAPLDEEAAVRLGQRLLDEGKIQVLLHFPSNFREGLVHARAAIERRDAGAPIELPEPLIYYNSANEKSKIAEMRVERILRYWRSQISEKNLTDHNVSVEATQAFMLKPRDVAEPAARRAAVWSKILPLVVLIWALTGAFYPAVDLCAGEKERGTLETLLTSPALRREIVWGKLLTVMLFSSATALLNLGSLGLTANFVVGQLQQLPGFDEMDGLALPSLASLGWLVLALLPISALFGALCLACAAFAKSTKEGQYYLMPLMFLSMPLMLLPMSMGLELNLGSSLIPLTGLSLLLRSLLEGQYVQAMPFVVPALGVTCICCLLAIRWAEEQFNSESVLFRESERLDLLLWLRDMVRNPGATPSLAQAALAFAMIMTVQFFVTIALSAEGEALTFPFLARSILLSQVACILLPTLMMTWLLTGDRAKTLLLHRRPRMSHVATAFGLAVLVHPLSIQLNHWITWLYPMSEETLGQAESIQTSLFGSAYWWAPFLLIAVLPAVCEELAFRGFILSGLRHLGHKWWAIGLSAVAFGAVHLFVQQKMSAAVLGLILGYLAIQTSSLWPCIAFHMTHNGLQLAAYKAARYAEAHPDSTLAKLLAGETPALYSPPALAACGLAVTAILWSLRRVNYARTKEEQLLEARNKAAPMLA